MQEERGLWYILGGVLALVVLTLAVYFLRPQPDYVDDSTPQGVVQNYVLAIYRADYERAYAYLADWENKPPLLDFIESMRASRSELKRISVRLGDTTRLNDRALVDAFIRYGSSGPFDSGWTNSVQFHLYQQDDGWKIRTGPYPFFQWDWPPDQPHVPGD